MRKLMYELADGTLTTSLAFAQAKGGYKVKMVEVAEKRPTPTPKRAAMLEKFGYVHPSLLGQI